MADSLIFDENMRTNYRQIGIETKREAPQPEVTLDASYEKHIYPQKKDV